MVLPVEVQEEIQELNETQLANLLAEIVYKVKSPEITFEFDDFDIVTDEVISDQLQCTNDWLGFASWVLDGLKQAHN